MSSAPLKPMMDKMRINVYMKDVEGETMGGWGSLGEVATKGACPTRCSGILTILDSYFTTIFSSKIKL